MDVRHTRNKSIQKTSILLQGNSERLLQERPQHWGTGCFSLQCLQLWLEVLIFLFVILPQAMSGKLEIFTVTWGMWTDCATMSWERSMSGRPLTTNAKSWGSTSRWLIGRILIFYLKTYLPACSSLWTLLRRRRSRGEKSVWIFSSAWSRDFVGVLSLPRGWNMFASIGTRGRWRPIPCIPVPWRDASRPGGPLMTCSTMWPRTNTRRTSSRSCILGTRGWLSCQRTRFL